MRLRTGKTKGSGSRLACLTMVFKLTMSAQKRWRALNGATSLLTDVIEGVKFEDGIKKEAAQPSASNTTLDNTSRKQGRGILPSYGD